MSPDQIAMLQASMDNWIDCSKKMPVERERVLCSTRFSGTVIAAFKPGCMGITRLAPEHWIGDSVSSIGKAWKFDDVTHWMPLPLPVQMPPLKKQR